MRDGSTKYLHALRSFVEELSASTGVALSISKENEDLEWLGTLGDGSLHLDVYRLR